MSSSNKIKVFPIYQGRDSKNGYLEMLQSFKIFSDNNIASFIILSETDKSSEFIEYKLKTAIDNCDFAIAIIDNDDRNTLEAGNLWYEIGMFRALRSRTDLFVFKKEGIKILASDYEITSITSDFTSYGDLEKQIYRILLDRIKEFEKKQKTTEKIDKKDKIQITYKTEHNSKPIWKNSKSYNCFHHGDFCDAKLDLLAYSSELIAVDFEKEVNSELYNLCLCIPDQIKVLKNHFQIEKREDYETIWVEKAQNIIDTCKRFISKIRKLISADLSHSGDEKIINFLRDFVINRKTNLKESLINNLEAFAQKFFKNIIDCENDEFVLIECLGDNPECMKRLNDILFGSRRMIRYLGDNKEYLDKTIELFIEDIRDNGGKNPNQINKVISATNKKLPYNKGGYNYWNDKIEKLENKQDGTNK